MIKLTDKERTKIVDELRQYQEKYPGETGVVEAFTNFILRNVDCLSRNCLHGHITTSAWIENREGTRFLLTKHKKLKKWLQLGGHVEKSGDLLSEALRESTEESGLENLLSKTGGFFDLGIYSIPEFNGVSAHYHYDVRFLLTSLDDEEKIKISDESDDLGWFESIPPGSGDLERMFEKWRLSQ